MALDERGTCLKVLDRLAPENRPDAIAEGQSIRSVYPEKAASAILETIRWAAVTKQTQTCDFTLPGANGTDRAFEARVTPLPDATGSGLPPAALILSREVTARRESERQRHDNAEIFQTLFRLSVDALLTLDLDGRPVEVNAQALGLFGFDDAAFQRMNLRDLFADGTGDAYRQFMSQLLRTGQARRSEQFRQADGMVFPGEIKAAVLRLRETHVLQVCIRDTRRRSEAAERVRIGKKMDAITQMARRMSHDYNNVLVGIVGGSSLLRMLAGEHPAQHPRMTEIEKAGEQMAAMTRRLQEIFAPADDVWETVDMEQVIRETTELARQSAPPVISIEVLKATEKKTVAGSRATIRQMLLNLMANGIEAMPSGGRLTVTLGAVTIDAESRPRHPGCGEAGRYLMVSVADAGVGMSEAVKVRIFEPFFTTKPPGQGSGLGLTTVYAGVQAHGGFIEAVSRPGQGATMTLYLPQAKAEPAAAPAAETVPREQVRILLADDEPVTLDATRHMLEELGYAVLTASGGVEAVACFREHARELDLLILNQSMPGVDGVACFRTCKAIHPQVRGILSSGYALDMREARLREAGFLGVLKKPYSLAQLGEALTRFLEGSAA